MIQPRHHPVPTLNNGFGQTVVQPPPTTVGFLYYRRDHNVGTQHDTDNSSSSVSMVAMFYEIQRLW